MRSLESQQPCSTLEPRRAGPDVAVRSRPKNELTLEWVGMEKVDCPIRLRLPTGEVVLTPATLDLAVSLDQSQTRGIHMSRLFTLAQKTLSEKTVSLAAAVELAADMLKSQAGLSQRAFLNIRTSLPVKRSALVSDESGWRQYPVWINVTGSPGGWIARMGVEILYSSTCPASAALAKQILLDRFTEDFGGRQDLSVQKVQDWIDDKGLPASPHAQRSRAVIEVQLRNPAQAPEFSELIDLAETRLGTPVQAAVKRVDEREFARLNAEHLMFCEDAARLLKSVLSEDERFEDFEVSVEHQESLHAHNAVARARK